MNSGIVFGRPWLKSEANILSGFDLGRFANAMMGSDVITLVTESFHELPYLIENLGSDRFFQLLESRTLKFLCQPEFVGVIGANSETYQTLAYGLVGTAIGIRNGSATMDQIVADSIAKNIFYNISLTSEQIETIAKATTLVPDIQKKILDQLGRDILDLSKRPIIVEFFRSYFKIDYSILDFVRVEIMEESVNIKIPVDLISSAPPKTNDRITTALLMLNEAYKGYALAGFSNAGSIFTDEVIFELMSKILHPEDPTQTSRTSVSIGVMMESIHLPDIGWLVNRGVLSISDVYSFRESNKGVKFRAFLKSFPEMSGEDVKNLRENMFRVIIDSFHGRTWWEKNWDSTTGKALRIGASTITGLIPGPGTLVSLAVSLFDFMLDSQMIPRNYKPTLVLEEKIKTYVDQEKLREEQKKKGNLPSLEKLQRMGYEATCVFKVDENTRKIVLHIPWEKNRFELGLDLHYPECNAYFRAFEELLPMEGSKERELVDAVADGYDIEQLTTNIVSKLKDGKNELVQEYLLRKGTNTISIIGNTEGFRSFTMSRHCFINPQEFSSFKKEVTGN